MKVLRMTLDSQGCYWVIAYNVSLRSRVVTMCLSPGGEQTVSTAMTSEIRQRRSSRAHISSLNLPFAAQDDKASSLHQIPKNACQVSANTSSDLAQGPCRTT